MTCDWLAWLVTAKFSMLTPLDRVRRDLKERGVPMAMGSLVSFIERAADSLAPIDGLHWQQLLASTWMATDGTGLKVLVPGLPAAHNGYIEVVRLFSAKKSGPRDAEPTRRHPGFCSSRASKPLAASQGSLPSANQLPLFSLRQLPHQLVQVEPQHS